METDNCLIIAAGLGSRIADLAKSKPLLEVAGKPLIQHVIENARQAGMVNFFIVSGYNGHLLRSFLDYYAESTGTNITHIINEDWESPNGVSVRAAKDIVPGEFCLLMSDHLFDAGILKDLVKLPVAENDVVLAVDGDIGNKYVNLDDVTRVKMADNNIVDIGKGIEDFNAYDTGIFKCGKNLFTALEKSSANGDDSLTGGIKYLITTGNAKCFEIGKRFWIDVDDEPALNMANDYFQT